MNINNEDLLGDVDARLQIAPLIDVVFLLLIYFMVTTALVKQEGDIPFMLPANVEPIDQIDIPVELMIQIEADGTVALEGMNFSKDDVYLSELVGHMMSMKQMADSQGSTFFVNIAPNEDTLHHRIINVMDACAAAKVKSLTFSKN
ncbi:MAG: biopolymer transporter ExbD [Kiritimatiellaceae bacterium]|nr:biopolymer transporter ExbD [Kiritimatiellaceae bacterium]